MIYFHMVCGCFQTKTQLSSWSQHYMVHNAENAFHLFLEIVQWPWLSGSVQACCGWLPSFVPEIPSFMCVSISTWQTENGVVAPKAVYSEPSHTVHKAACLGLSRIGKWFPLSFFPSPWSWVVDLGLRFAPGRPSRNLMGDRELGILTRNPQGCRNRESEELVHRDRSPEWTPPDWF